MSGKPRSSLIAQTGIHGGANHALTLEFIQNALQNAQKGEWLILQNEVNLVPEIAHFAREKGMKICYSAAPFIESDALNMIDKIDLLAVNEGEASALSHAIGKDIHALSLPMLLITKGKAGAILHLAEEDNSITQNAFEVEAVDSTGAGDVFLGAFMAHFTKTADAQSSLKWATAASAIQVTRAGAANAIPSQAEIAYFLRDKI